VFLAEDDPAFRSLLAWALREDGHIVQEFADGYELLLACHAAAGHTELPDLLICDLSMPILSGLDAVACARERLEDVPIVLVTAHAEEAVLERATELNLVAVFRKPFDVDALRRAVTSLLEPTQLAPWSEPAKRQLGTG
jgi:CheY-like chemotaxis protein